MRPPFARRYPKDAELDALVDAFGRGDFARVRAQAPELAEKTEDPQVRAAALDLRQRIEPSRFSLYLLALGFALLVFLYLHYLRR